MPMEEFVTVKYSKEYKQPASILWQIAAAYSYALSQQLPFYPYCEDAPYEIKEVLRNYYGDIIMPRETPAVIWSGYFGSRAISNTQGPGSIAGYCYSPLFFEENKEDVLKYMSRFAGNELKKATAVFVDNKVDVADCTRRSTSSAYLKQAWSMLPPGEKRYVISITNMEPGSYIGLYKLDKVFHRPDEKLYTDTLTNSLAAIKAASACSSIIMAPNHASWWAACLAGDRARVLYPVEWARVGSNTAEVPMESWEMVSTFDYKQGAAKWPTGCMRELGYTFKGVI